MDSRRLPRVITKCCLSVRGSGVRVFVPGDLVVEHVTVSPSSWNGTRMRAGAYRPRCVNIRGRPWMPRAPLHKSRLYALPQSGPTSSSPCPPPSPPTWRQPAYVKRVELSGPVTVTPLVHWQWSRDPQKSTGFLLCWCPKKRDSSNNRDTPRWTLKRSEKRSCGISVTFSTSSSCLISNPSSPPSHLLSPSFRVRRLLVSIRLETCPWPVPNRTSSKGGFSIVYSVSVDCDMPPNRGYYQMFLNSDSNCDFEEKWSRVMDFGPKIPWRNIWKWLFCLLIRNCIFFSF